MTISKLKTHKTKRVELQEVMPTDIPGINAPQLEDRQVARRSPKVISYTHTIGDGIGVRYFDGFGFRPRTLMIKAWKDNTNEYAVFSDGMIDEDGVSSAMYVRPDGDRNSILNDTSTTFLLRDEANDITGGSFVSYGSDGVNIDVESADFNAKIVITAYE